jgi:hypothetical protein
MIVAFAVSMAGAAAAQAAVFTAAEYPAFVSGGQSESSPLTLGFEGGQAASCEFAGFAGEITEATSGLKVGPGFGLCTAFGFAESTVEANGCELVLHPGSGSKDEFTGSFDIACPAGKAIVVEGGNCEVQIGSQTGLGPVSYDLVTVTEPIEVEASFEMEAASGFTYNKSLDGASCPLSGTGVKAGGVLGGGATVRAGNIETLEPIAFGIE